LKFLKEIDYLDLNLENFIRPFDYLIMTERMPSDNEKLPESN